MAAPLRLLHVDAHESDHQSLEGVFANENGSFEVVHAASFLAMIKRLETGVYDVVLSDLHLPGATLAQIVAAIHTHQPNVPVVVLTSETTVATVVAAMKSGAADYLLKTPATIQRLPVTVRAIAEQHSTAHNGGVDLNDLSLATADSTTHDGGVKVNTPHLDHLALLNYLFDINPLAMVTTVQATGRIIAANRSYLRFLAYQRDEVIGCTTTELQLWANNDDRTEMLDLLERDGVIRERETQVRTKDGRLCTVLLFIEPITFRGEPCLLAMFVDITESVRSKGQLQFQADILANVSDAIITTDQSFVITSWNSAAEAIYGWSAAETVGRSVNDVVATQYTDGRSQADHAGTLFEQGSWRSEVIQRRRDGGEIIVLCAASLLHDKNGELVGVVAVNRDVTQWRQIEDQLRSTQELLTALLDHIPTPIAVLSADQHYQLVNRAWSAASRIAKREVIGQPIDHVHPATVAHDIRRSHQYVITTADPLVSEERTKGHDEGAFVQIIRFPICHSDGAITAVGEISIDITERKRAEATREQLLRESQFNAKIGFALSQSNITDIALQQCSEAIAAFVDAELVHIWLADADQTLVLHAQAGASNATNTVPNCVSIEHSHVGRVVQEGAPVVSIGSVTTDELADLADQFTGFAGCPLIIEGRLLGVLGLYAHQPFREADLDSLSSSMMSMAQNIERKRIEVALQESEERYNLAVRGSSDGIWDWTARTNCVYFSPRFCELIGSPTQTTLDAMLLMTFVHPDDLVRAGTVIDNHVVQRTPFSIELRLRAASGAHRWFLVRGQAIWDEAGQPTRVAGSLTDIHDGKMAQQALEDFNRTLEARVKRRTASLARTNTELQREIDERVRIEQALRQSENKYRLLAEEVSDMISQHTLTGEYIYASPSCRALVGYEPEELVGHAAYEFFHPDDIAIIQASHSQIVENLEIFTVTYRLRHKQGHYVWLETTSKMVYHSALVGDGEILCVSRDVTQRKAAEAALNHANAELEQAARLKDEFLASMSHELRTPLNAVLGRSEALLDEVYGTLSDRQITAVQSIEAGGKHLLALISDILDLSKIGSGQFEIDKRLVAVDVLCEMSFSLVIQEAEHKRLKLALNLDPHVPVVCADERRMLQILVNLLSNAVKFTPTGGQVGLDVVGDREQKIVRFSVWDTGIGISAQDQCRLFKPFVQLDSSLSRQYAGTGLGLALVAGLTELHNGTVRLQSAKGEGSRFTVALPWSPPL